LAGRPFELNRINAREERLSHAESLRNVGDELMSRAVAPRPSW
jgi:hypothetical protein